MRCFLAALLLFFPLSCFAGQASDEINYFKTISAEDMPQALKEVKVETCEEFFDHYFNVEKDDPKVSMQALAYDAGLCVEQDLAKALQLYEQSYEFLTFVPSISVRLALIYEFGPESLRSPERASLMRKQAVIIAAYLPDKNLRYRLIHKIVNETLPIPESFEKDLEWIESILQKSDDEKREIAQKLENQGLDNTRVIWNPIDNINPIETK